MTKEMEAIWERTDSDIDYTHVTTHGWRFATSNHGEGKFILTAWAGKSPCTMHMRFYLDRDDMTVLADLIASALGGCLYIASEDSDSELGRAELDVGPEGLLAESS